MHTIRDVRLSRKKIILFALSVTVIGITLTYSIWTITTPKWSFSVSTDKSTYRLGEDVKITVSLKNLGFITHPLKSRVSNPVVVSIEYQYTENPTNTYQVWYSPYHYNITEFSIKPDQSLERNFIWNQTNIHLGEKVEVGNYHIRAFIPSADSTMSIDVDNLFLNRTSMNITSSE